MTLVSKAIYWITVKIFIEHLLCQSQGQVHIRSWSVSEKSQRLLWDRREQARMQILGSLPSSAPPASRWKGLVLLQLRLPLPLSHCLAICFQQSLHTTHTSIRGWDGLSITTCHCPGDRSVSRLSTNFYVVLYRRAVFITVTFKKITTKSELWHRCVGSDLLEQKVHIPCWKRQAH